MVDSFTLRLSDQLGFSALRNRGSMPVQQKQSIRRSTRVLQFCSCVLLGIGLLLVLPFAFITDTGLAGSFAGYFSLTAAASGLLGLYFTWQRGLVLFTVMTWTLSLETAIVMTQCAPPAQCPLPLACPMHACCDPRHVLSDEFATLWLSR